MRQLRNCLWIWWLRGLGGEMADVNRRRIAALILFLWGRVLVGTLRWINYDLSVQLLLLV